MSTSPPPNTWLPLTLGALDHYTLIVPDGKASCDFHVNCLGFRFLRMQDVGTEDKTDLSRAMRNYILEIPASDGRTCVITEGLCETSIFTRYMRKFGAGIHHVAYAVTDIEASIAALRAAGTVFTSTEILRDPLSNLRQIFIDRDHAGYFIELIERTGDAPVGYFTNTNMSRLAATMDSYVDEPDESADALSLPIAVPAEAVMALLADAGKLPLWTCHRSLRHIGDRLVEVRLHGDVDVTAARDPGGVTYHFARAGQVVSTRFTVTPTAADACCVSAELPALPPPRLRQIRKVVAAELRLLRALLAGGGPVPVLADEEKLVLEHSQTVYARREL